MKKKNMNTISKKERSIVDYLKGFQVDTELDFKMVSSLVSSLSEEALEELESLAVDSFVSHRCCECQKRLLRGYRRNTPFKELLALYTDKRSGMVEFSKNELFRRFPSLDFKQQCTVLAAFLAGCETDRLKMANYLLDGKWDEGYSDILLKAWRSYPGSSALNRLVVNFAPLPIVMANRMYFDKDKALAVRLCEAGTMPSVETWGPVDYLAIRYHAGNYADEQQVRSLVQQYLVSAAKYALEHSRIPDYSAKAAEDSPSFIFLDGVRILLYYVGKMQMVDVLDWFRREDCDFRRRFDIGTDLDDADMTGDRRKVCIWKSYCKKLIETYDSPEFEPVKIRLTEDMPHLTPDENEKPKNNE